MVQKVSPSRVGPSKRYLKKESVREKLQGLVKNSISSGEVTNQDELEEFFKTAQMALDALKMVTYEAFLKL